MRFTKKDLIKLLDSYGRAFYNPSLNGKSKQNFLKIIKAESFPLATVEELSEKLNFLYNKYNLFKSGSEKKFEYFSYVDKAVKLATQDYMPKETTIELSYDDTDEEEEECIPVDVPITQKSNKRHHDEDIQAIAKKVRFDDNYELIQKNEIPNEIQNEIQCVKIDDSVLQGIELNVTNAVLESLKKQDEEKAKSLQESFQSMKNEIRSLIKNGTTEVLQTMQKEHRLSNLNVMAKTLLDEQTDATEILMEIRTLLKSTIAGQKVQHEMDTKRYELEKSNEILLKQVLSMLKDNNNSQE